MCCRGQPGGAKTCPACAADTPLPLVPSCACACARCCRGGGWGPLRRAPVQHLDMRGRPGLLRTTLEAQETRGLTRSDDLSRLLPSEVGAELGWSRPSQGCVACFSLLFLDKTCCTFSVSGGTNTTRAPAPSKQTLAPAALRSAGGAAGAWAHRAPGQALLLCQDG